MKTIVHKFILIGVTFITLGVGYVFSLMVFLHLYGTNDTAMFNENAIIVLGAAVWEERVSQILANRLNVAVRYHQKNPEALIVVSGGQGQGAITEAEAMRRFLINRGVPEELIIKEDRSTNTYENITFSKAILDGIFDGEYNVVIITNAFHIYRAVTFARRQGMNATHMHTGLPLRFMPWNYTRESVGVTRLWVLGY